MTNSFPFDSIHSDSIIWQIGSGMKAPLTDIQACHEAKVHIPIAHVNAIILGYFYALLVFQSQRSEVIFVSASIAQEHAEKSTPT